jgi:hypothetical protein
MLRIVAFAILLSLPGCISAEERARIRKYEIEKQMEEDHYKCASYGFIKSTPEYSHCRLTLEQDRTAAKLREEERRHQQRMMLDVLNKVDAIIDKKVPDKKKY